MTTNEKKSIALVLVVIFIYLIAAYFMKLWPFNNNGSDKRISSKPCCCEDPKCKGECIPCGQRIVTGVVNENIVAQRIPIEMPPSKR